MSRRCLNPPGRNYPGYSEVVVVGDWITVSGQLPLERGTLVGRDEPKTQVEQCFKNIAAALSLAGAQLSDVVKLTCYVTDAAVYPFYSEVKARLFHESPPAGTLVVVAGLLVPGAVLEIDAVAALPART